MLTCVDCGKAIPTPTPDPFRCHDCNQKRNGGASTMLAEDAMAEIWGTICPDCGPTDYVAIVEAVRRLSQEKAIG